MTITQYTSWSVSLHDVSARFPLPSSSEIVPERVQPFLIYSWLKRKTGGVATWEWKNYCKRNARIEVKKKCENPKILLTGKRWESRHRCRSARRAMYWEHVVKNKTKNGTKIGCIMQVFKSRRLRTNLKPGKSARGTVAWWLMRIALRGGILTGVKRDQIKMTSGVTGVMHVQPVQTRRKLGKAKPLFLNFSRRSTPFGDEIR